MDIQLETDTESVISAPPQTYPIIYLDELWNVVGFNGVAKRLFQLSGDPLWFSQTGTLHVFDILCSDRGKTMLASGQEESLNLTVLCFRAHVEQDTSSKRSFEAIWSRLTQDYPLIREVRSARITEPAAKRAYGYRKKLISGESVFACRMMASLESQESESPKLQFVCVIARNDSDPLNPSAFQVCLVPETTMSEIEIMLNAFGVSTSEMTLELQRVPSNSLDTRVARRALENVIRAGLSDATAPERYHPTQSYVDEIKRLSKPSASLECELSVGGDGESLTRTHAPWSWKGYHQRSSLKLTAEEMDDALNRINAKHRDIMKQMEPLNKITISDTLKSAKNETVEAGTPRLQGLESSTRNNYTRTAIGQIATTSVPRIRTLDFDRFETQRKQSDEIGRRMAERSTVTTPPVRTLDVERFEEQQRMSDEIARRMARRSQTAQ